MATVCLKCGVATAVGVEMGYMGLPSLDETPRGKGKHRLSAQLTVSGGDPRYDETFGCLYSGLLAVGLSTHAHEAYRDFLKAHSGGDHALRLWIEEQEDLPEGTREPRYKWYKAPRRAPGFVRANVRFSCRKCEEDFESAAAEWVRPMEPHNLTKTQVDKLVSRTVRPSEHNIRDAFPFEILLFHELARWLRSHGAHPIRIELVSEPAAPRLASASAHPPGSWTPPAIRVELDERRLGAVSSETVPLLVKLCNRDPRKREEAAQRLAALAESETVGHLAAHLDDPDVDVRRAVVRALGAISDPRTVRPLGTALLDESSDVQEAARKALLHAKVDPSEALTRAREPRAPLDRSKEKEPAPAVKAADPRHLKRSAAADKLRAPGDAALLLALLEDCSDSVVERAAHTAGELRLRDAVEPLCRATERAAFDMTGEQLLIEIAEALGKIADPAAVPTLVSMLDRWKLSVSRVHDCVLNALTATPGEAASAGLVHALDAPDESLRMSAARVLGERKDARAVAGLARALEDPNQHVRACAAQALTAIDDSAGNRAILAAAVAGDRVVAEAAHVLLIRLGDPRTEAVLIEAIKYAGSHDWVTAATTYILSGNEKLAVAGKAALHGRAPAKRVKAVAWASRPLESP
jgi:HEAT repeat protein